MGIKRLILLVIFLTSFYGAASGLKKDFDFMGFKLWMSQSEITNTIELNTNLQFDDCRYLGKINDVTPLIMKASFFPYINEIYFQFYSNQCYSIVIQFNPAYFDYITLTGTLQDNYGEPVIDTSQNVDWNDWQTDSVYFNKDVKLRLEYPSTVKLYDNAIMIKANTYESNEVFKATNESIVESAKRNLLGEL